VDEGIDRIEISLGKQIMACGTSCEWTLDDMAIIGMRWTRTIAKVSNVVHVGLQLAESAVVWLKMTTIRGVRIRQLAKSAIVWVVTSMLRCLGIRMGKVQKRVLKAAGYMSTFIVGIWTQRKILKTINMIQLHENTGNGDIGEKQ
jgi:hypothetical protein